MHARRIAVALLLVLALTGQGAGADTEGAPSSRVALDNTSYVDAHAARLRKTIEAVDGAIRADDWPTAVRRLQSLVDTVEDPENPGAVVPWVLPVYGSVVYEGAWIVAHHRILAGGARALEAYAAEFSAGATAMLQRAVEQRDAARLAEVATRWLPLAEGRRAALMLAEISLERGDGDGAMAWLERLEDVEEVTAEPEEALAPWRRARIGLQAAVLARPERVGEVIPFLTAIARGPEDPRLRHAPVPPGDRRPAAPAATWPTTGGGPRRDALPAALGTRFELAWWRPLEGGFWPADPSERPPRDRPSPWMPTAGVVDGTEAFVCDGSHLEVWDLATGRRLARPVPLTNDENQWLDRVDEVSAREELGLLEGHSLTLGPRTPEGRLVYVAAPDPTAGTWWNYDYERDDRLQAWLWNRRSRRLSLAWRNGGASARGGLPDQTRLYGAPLLYRGRLWMPGVRPTRGAEHEADAWLFSFDPATGDVITRTYLGSGAPIRPGRPDEAIPSSPAGAAGRVVVSTSLGIVAAVDAVSGRPQWLYKNDRGVVSSGRPRRLQNEEDKTPRQSGFANRPPITALERTWVAPTDGPYLLCLFDRPRGSSRELVSYRCHRRLDLLVFAAEQTVGLVANVAGNRALLVVAGKGGASEGQPPAPIARGLDALTLEPVWEAFATTGDGPEPYGAALMTEGEVFVPTRQGISVFDVANGNDLATLDRAAVSELKRELLGPDVPLSGNLIPVPGLGVLALSGTHGAFWRIIKRR